MNHQVNIENSVTLGNSHTPPTHKSSSGGLSQINKYYHIKILGKFYLVEIL